MDDGRKPQDFTLVTDPQLRLFAGYCCRQFWEQLSPASRKAVLLAELHAFGQASDTDLTNGFVISYAERPDFYSTAANCTLFASALRAAKNTASCCRGINAAIDFPLLMRQAVADLPHKAGQWQHTLDVNALGDPEH